MTTVTRPMSLGQGKRIAAICVDMIPVGEISEIQAKALISGDLKRRLENFWRMEALSGLHPTCMYQVMPTVDLSCLQGVVDNIVDFKQEEFYFPDGFEPKFVEPIILPINYSTCIRDLSEDIRSAGYRTATPEEALGMLKEKEKLLRGQWNRKIVVITNNRFHADLFVIEYYSDSNRLVVLREKRNREDLLNGGYSVLVVEEKKKE